MSLPCLTAKPRLAVCRHCRPELSKLERLALATRTPPPAMPDLHQRMADPARSYGWGWVVATNAQAGSTPRPQAGIASRTSGGAQVWLGSAIGELSVQLGRPAWPLNDARAVSVYAHLTGSEGTVPEARPGPSGSALGVARRAFGKRHGSSGSTARFQPSLPCVPIMRQTTTSSPVWHTPIPQRSGSAGADGDEDRAGGVTRGQGQRG